MKKHALILLPLAFNHISASAAWASGGGELFRDAANPWFLQNTSTVNYCIQIDEAAFGVKRDYAENLVQKAIEYWKNEFRYAMSSPSRFPQIKVATQNFVLGSCALNTDLTFQLGVLTPEQLAEFKRQGVRPQQLVGVAVRTHYDEVYLKGKGFIYLSPENGPLKMEGENLSQNPWSFVSPYHSADRHGGVLHKALVHELGHVFGLQHAASPDVNAFPGHNEIAIMDADYPEVLISTVDVRRPEAREDLRWIPGVFSPTRGKYGYYDKPRPNILRFFDFEKQSPLDAEALEFITKDRDIEVVSESVHGAVPVGLIRFAAAHPTYEQFPAVKIRMNPRQIVFPGAGKREEINGPGFATFHAPAKYTSYKSGVHRQVFISYNPAIQSFRIGGIIDGELIFDLGFKE